MLHLTRRLLVLMLANSIVAAAQTQSSAPGGAPEPDLTVDAMSAEIRIIPPTPPSTEENRGWLPPGTDPNNTLGWSFVKHLASDQKAFWTSAKDLKGGGAKTFVPFAAFTGLLIASDSWLAKQLPDKPNQLNRSNHISQYATYSLVGAAGGAFLLGHLTKNDHMAETGLLSGEALLNSTAVTYAFRAVLQRERPLTGDGSGKFFQGGTSFPSEHSAIAWSVASVVAHEYPGPLTKLAAYGLASAVTLTRVTSKQHFASDAVVGSALGWYFGRQVYRAHHDPELGGTSWGNFLQEKNETSRNPENMGSPYVPVDSWVYPLFDRLAALGYVQSGYFGIRPWTRMECARLLQEAGELMRYEGVEGGEAQRLYTALLGDFDDETARLNGAGNLGVSLDSVYLRTAKISGTPLRDGFHFGQTLINDFGRPYGEGFNGITGVTAHAVAGPFAFYIRGEYQHAPAVPSHLPGVLQAIASADRTPVLADPYAQVDKFQLLDSTVAVNIRNVQVSFGKQSLWLGPSDAGPALFSNNAEPIVMLKIDHVSPYHFPLLSYFLGPVRTEFFIGQLSGHHWVSQPPRLFGPDINPQPYIHGSKISFKPTPNLEFGFGFTSQFAGQGLPFTWHNFLRTFYSHRAKLADNPGKRLSAFDFSYHIPGLRKWLVLYSDSFVIDEYSPIGSSRPSINPGIYLPQIPKIPKMDLRVEGVSTDLPTFPTRFVGSVYTDSRYLSGYTNNRNLLGNWVGRMGTGEQVWATYWFSPRNTLQLGYRHQDVNRHFIGGGHLQDVSVKTELMLRHDLSLSGYVQYEDWRFPVLSPGAKSNVTGSIQLTFWPSWRKK